MSQNLYVVTQGINQNPFMANGSYDELHWGNMTPDQLLDFLKQVQSLVPPNYDSGEDLCPPNVMVRNEALRLDFANLNFALNGPALLFMDVENSYECLVTPFEAVSLATGQKAPGDLVAEKTSQAPPPRHGFQPGQPKFRQQPQRVAPTAPDPQPVYRQSPPSYQQAPQPAAAPPRPRRVVKKRGVVKALALLIGIALIVLGGMAVIGGEMVGGLVLCGAGLLPALWGWKKKAVEERGADQGYDGVHYQDWGDSDYDDGGADFDVGGD